MTGLARYLCPQHGEPIESGDGAFRCHADPIQTHETVLAIRARDRELVRFCKDGPPYEPVVKEGV